ncbi:MAG TPA: Rossmann-like and DUF2520 domain-containing protein [Pyrinomonadaceae bacterium]|jgi:predicted short-subunit dehydrogenase-like oxidoreductase (DUF2520 family)|nr:Rossmann-like and DUF2520 domain-containing protein [Pyrinomonadaceae bacterium]
MTKRATTKQKPSVAIIGAGRVGQALALALQSSGYSIIALVARRRWKAEKAATLLHKRLNKTKPPPLVFAANQLAEVPPTDLILISTPDDLIAEVAHSLSGLWSARKRSTILHTSGALSSAVLRPLEKSGFQTGSIHPLISISDPVSGAAALHGAFFCLEGDRKAKLVAQAIVRDLGGSNFSIKPEHKALYHAAAVMAAPHVTALVDLAIETLAACGLSKRKAQQVFVPLLESTVNNLKTSSPEQALTGTFARGDIATVRRHLDSFSGKQFAAALEVYNLLGLHSLRMMEKNGLDSKLIQQIIDLIKQRAGQRPVA